MSDVNAITNNTYERLIRDVCRVFNEVTGVSADPKREAGAIMPLAKEGWEIYDFRLLIEFQFQDDEASKWFKQPGRMNLRNFFNPARKDILLDIREDLKVRDVIMKKQKELGDSPRREPKLLMKCGSQIYRKDYDRHMNQCFQNRGLCFFPEPREEMPF